MNLSKVMSREDDLETPKVGTLSVVAESLSDHTHERHQELSVQPAHTLLTKKLIKFCFFLKYNKHCPPSQNGSRRSKVSWQRSTRSRWIRSMDFRSRFQGYALPSWIRRSSSVSGSWNNWVFVILCTLCLLFPNLWSHTMGVQLQTFVDAEGNDIVFFTPVASFKPSFHRKVDKGKSPIYLIQFTSGGNTAWYITLFY